MKRTMVGLVFCVLAIGCTTYKAEYREDARIGTTELVITETTAFGKSVLNGNAAAQFHPETGNLDMLGLGTDAKVDATQDAEFMKFLFTIFKAMAAQQIPAAIE